MSKTRRELSGRAFGRRWRGRLAVVVVLPACSARVAVAWAFHLEDVVDVRVEVAGQTADWAQLVHVDPARGRVVELVANVKIDDLADDEAVGAAADRDDAIDAALEAGRRLDEVWRPHLDTGRRRETCQGKLVHRRRIFAGRQVHVLRERIVDDVDDEVTRMLDVGDRILLAPLASAR